MNNSIRLKLEQTYWNTNAQDPDVQKKYICDLDTNACIKALGDFSQATKILDLGCGIGRITSILTKKHDVTGIDISEGMLAIARQSDTKTKYLQNNGRTIPIDDNTFDFAYSILLFQHLETETIKGYLKEIYRVLQPDGMFCFQYIPGEENEPFSHHYDPKQIHEWLHDAQLESISEKQGLVHPMWAWHTAKKQGEQ